MEPCRTIRHYFLLVAFGLGLCVAMGYYGTAEAADWPNFRGPNHNGISNETGEVKWSQKGMGTGSLMIADGHLYFRYQNNVVALIEANPRRYNLKSTFTLPKRQGMSGEGWPHPVIIDGNLYIRHADVLLVYDIKAKHSWLNQ